MRRTCSLFIRYKSFDTDEVVSRFVNIHISEIPVDMRKIYEERRDLEHFMKWYLHHRYRENTVEILNISLLNSLDDFLVEGV